MSIVSHTKIFLVATVLACLCSGPILAQPGEDRESLPQQGSALQQGSVLQQGSADATQGDASRRPLMLPPRGRPDRATRSPEYWVGELSHDQYLRRELATEQLIGAGAASIPAIVEVLKTGDLETVERAMTVISEIALTQPPNEDGGAWGALNQLASHASGIRSSRAEAAIAEVRELRGRQARDALLNDGIFVGLDEFIVRSTSAPRMIVEIGDAWGGDIANLQWLRWLDGIEWRGSGELPCDARCWRAWFRCRTCKPSRSLMQLWMRRRWNRLSSCLEFTRSSFDTSD